jgi:uncharacterized protein YidB (DUF937 family)
MFAQTLRESQIMSNPIDMAGDLLNDVASQFFDGAGGLAGLRKRFEDQNLGHVYQSWVNKQDKPLAITPDQMCQLVGGDARRLAAKHTIDESAVPLALAQHLPLLVRRAAGNEDKIDPRSPT